MKVCGLRFRLPMMMAFGAGFLLGSRAGRGPWEAVSAKVAELQGKAEEHFGGNGQSAYADTHTEPAGVPFTEI